MLSSKTYSIPHLKYCGEFSICEALGLIPSGKGRKKGRKGEGEIERKEGGRKEGRKMGGRKEEGRKEGREEAREEERKMKCYKWKVKRAFQNTKNLGTPVGNIAFILGLSLKL
jgi:hypothetical protein